MYHTKTYASLLIVLTLTICGCRGNPAQQRSAAQAKLQTQALTLQQASAHLAEAQARLSAEPDPRDAGEELKLGADGIKQAATDNHQIQQQVIALGKTAEHLQADIDKHKDDLLGPRGHRILWGTAIVLTLLLLGTAFLQVGPSLGGVWGGGLIVLGHLLTACLVPAWRLLTGWAAALFGWIVALLSRIGNSQAATNVPQATGATHA